MKQWLKSVMFPWTIGVLVLAVLFISLFDPDAAAKSNTQIAYYAVNSEPVLDWDPSVEFSNGIQVLTNVYETLTLYDSKTQKIKPVLSTEWSKSDDGLTWTFKIRKGVKFHDDSEVNAQAVKFSIERTMKIGKGAAYIWDAVERIDTPDDYTVIFNLRYPSPIDLVAATGYAAFIMSPKSVKANAGDWLSKGNEAGSGPYKLRSQKMGVEVVLTKFDDYWRGWDGKHFEIVVFKKISESSSRRQLVESGKADITVELPVEDIDDLKNNKNVVVDIAPSFTNLILMLNTRKKPLDNVDVRKALSYAFPYAKVVKYVAGGYATQSRGVVPYGMWGHGGNDLMQYKHDLVKAREHLAKAGLADGGFKLLFTYNSSDETQKKAAEMYKSELARLNIELEIRGMPWESQWDLSKGTDPDKRQDILCFYWWPDIISPYSWMYSLYHSQEEILFNLAYWSSPEVDNAMDVGNKFSAIDRLKAGEYFVDAQKLLLEAAPSIFVYDRQYVTFLNKSFKGHKYNPAYSTVVFFYNTYRE